MTANNSEAMELSLKNRKKAYGAMCKATILLFVFSFLSMATNTGVTWLLDKYGFAFQKLLVKFIGLFGVDSHTALLAVRSLMSSNAFYDVIQMLLSVFTLVIPAAIFAKSAHLDADECFNVKGRCIKGLVPMIGMCQMIITFTLTFSSIIMTVFVSPVFGFEASLLDYGTVEFDFIEFTVMTISNAVLVPVIEEFMFRGVVLSYLKRYGTVYAVVASSLLFGIAHSSPEQSVFAFSFGLVAAFCSVVTGNIKTSIILHAFNNFTYVLNNYTFGTQADAIIRAINLLIFGLGFAGLYYTLRSGGHMDVFREKKTHVDKQAVLLPGVREILTVPVIVYILLYAVRFVSEMMM